MPDHNSNSSTLSNQQSTTNTATTTTTASSFLNTKTLATLVALLAFTLALLAPFRSSLSKALASSNTVRNMSSTTSPALKITKRPWAARGHADHDWLYTFHTFSFASYYDPRHESFGPLRVINEDRVKAGTGFGTHSHSEFLIFSYIVNGVLEHKDSMGNLENLKRGEVQFTSAGTGIRHSEYNRNRDSEVHFLQIWAKPNKRGLKPHYETKKFTDEQKQDKLVRIMEYTDRLADSKDSIGLQADLSMDASILSPGKTVTHDLVADGERKVYVHVVMNGRTQPKDGGAKIKVGDTVLGEGDGAYIAGAQRPGKIEIESVGDKPAEFLLFDLGNDDA
ncbi:RmlC-like cupin [Aaosphaeria arxii CBS 175.79]|uniref:RmlC-like cupin n=1 Tax=Aaosphaeria arxii CBS 175.79 TaxID=1450172 RepID=A0A6A5XMT1_9PLEO|nr:RmlC-like cupin [Aaosphaeria arxii CBS 175.79]KAF2014179.1 RmlC-like cupin [Aaosphaeria arxii CBS 175.79]